MIGTNFNDYFGRTTFVLPFYLTSTFGNEQKEQRATNVTARNKLEARQGLIRHKRMVAIRRQSSMWIEEKDLERRILEAMSNPFHLRGYLQGAERLDRDESYYETEDVWVEKCSISSPRATLHFFPLLSTFPDRFELFMFFPDGRANGLVISRKLVVWYQLMLNFPLQSRRVCTRDRNDAVPKFIYSSPPSYYGG